MAALITYTYNPDTDDQKLYGLVRIKADDNHEDDIIWLASTLDKNNFSQWQLLKSFKGIIKPDILYGNLTTMQIKDNLIYISNRGQKTLFIINIKDIYNGVVEYPLPAQVDDQLELYQTQSLFIQPTSSGANLYICADNKILLSKPTDRKTWTTFYEADDDSLIVIRGNEDMMVLQAFDKPAVLYIAPMGSNKFEKHSFPHNSEPNQFYVFYGIFFNSRSRIMALLDMNAQLRSFSYEVINKDTISISKQIAVESHFGWTVGAGPIIGTLADATSFGGNINVGVVLKVSDYGVFQPAGINSKGEITKRPEASFNLVNTPQEYHTTEKLTLDTHGPIFFLDFTTLFYTSTDLGINWVQQSLTFSGPKA